MGSETHSSGGFLFSGTPVFGLPFYALLLAISAAALLFALLLFYLLRRRFNVKPPGAPPVIPICTKEIAEIALNDKPVGMVELKKAAHAALPAPPVMNAANPSEGESSSSSSSSSSVEKERKMENIGWGRWYTLAELEAATSVFSDKNVIGEGGYGIVYRGVLPDLSVVAVKYLLNNKGQAEKEFKVEVEAIGKVRHKNLVGLIGYCAEGAKRLLVYEYIDNGTLEQWLHGSVGPISPLTWNVRMKIATGTAKGIAYLHEGLEPKVIHRDIKSSNILLDKQWNPKVSDFGLAKVLGSGSSYVTTRVMGTFGYVAPEYACTGMLNESSDVYSFGVLLMEIISGRSPVDYSKPPGEVNMVEWFKRTIQSKRDEEVLDPLLDVKPTPRALKRNLLICLRCTDMDAQKRPKMGQIVHMLEGDEFPFRIEHRSAREGTLTSYMSSKLAPPASSERSMW